VTLGWLRLGNVDASEQEEFEEDLVISSVRLIAEKGRKSDAGLLSGLLNLARYSRVKSAVGEAIEKVNATRE